MQPLQPNTQVKPLLYLANTLLLPMRPPVQLRSFPNSPWLHHCQPLVARPTAHNNNKPRLNILLGQSHMTQSALAATLGRSADSVTKMFPYNRTGTVTAH